MRILALATLTLTLTPTPAPDYDPLELYQLVATAERVVAGSIVALDEKSFDLTVERELLGDNSETTIRVERFVDWMCARRWDEYRVGQRVVLFLYGSRAMGAGDEGDWPLDVDVALAPFRVHGLERAKRTVGEDELERTPIELAELAQAITGYRATFRASLEEVGGRSELRFRYALDESAAEKYAQSSVLARHLVEETLSSTMFRGATPPRAPPLASRPVIRARADGFSGPPVGSTRWDRDFGRVMACAGDVNGDGWDDLAIKGERLALWILLLDPAERRFSRQAIEPADAGAADHYFGESLTSIGDFDGDGVGDIAAGAPAREKDVVPRVLLLLLNRDGSLKQTLPLSGDALTSFAGSPGFGANLTAVGDMDGNGTVDLMADVKPCFAGIGLDLLFRGGEREPHRLPILQLDETGAVLRATELAAEDILGKDTLDGSFGDALAGIGDLDGNGISEVAIGFPYDDDGGEERGAVWIVFLERDGSLRARTKISDWSGDFAALLVDGDHFGQALAAPGDLDDDGVPDLIVGGEKELWMLALTRDGTVKRSQQFGQRAGGFVSAARLRSLAVLRGPENSRRLAVCGLRAGKNPMEAVVWMLNLGPGLTLSAP